MAKHHSKILLPIVLLIIAFGVSGYILMSSRPQKTTSYPPPAAVAVVPTSSSVTSPDGRMSINLTEEKAENTVNYKFSIKDETTGSQNQIYYKSVANGITMSLPSNAFSPDNKYVFIKETDPDKNQFFVLKSSGEPMNSSGQMVEVISLFEAKYSIYKVTDVTGWAAPNLIVVNTDKSEGGIGPSFWFELGSNSFIPLGTRFN